MTIDDDFPGHLERIRDFLRLESVSAGDGDLRETAAAVCELIEESGGGATVAEPGERRPTVIGVIDGPPPTVLRYGMYDVQPPGPGWTREPFAAVIDGGRIYARGAANSKAALAAGLLAFASAPSPCRQVLLMDGEEERGSSRLAAFCAQHREEPAADFALDFDLVEEADGTAPVVAGCTSSSCVPAAAPTSTPRWPARCRRPPRTWPARSWRCRRRCRVRM
jgi:acetylornithine deacetylase/succinyl-diaminopimelate desuccinylase-like protein